MWKIFLSYPSEARAEVEPVAHALMSNGNSVFYDHVSLQSGAAYSNQIFSEIDSCDCFVFFITPDSVRSGRYTLTELEIACRTKTASSLHIVPVLLAEMAMDKIPEALRPIQMVRAKGNLAAETAECIFRLQQSNVQVRVFEPGEFSSGDDEIIAIIADAKEFVMTCGISNLASWGFEGYRTALRSAAARGVHIRALLIAEDNPSLPQQITFEDIDYIRAGIGQAHKKWHALAALGGAVEVRKVLNGVLTFKLMANEKRSVYTPLWKSLYSAREGVRISAATGTTLYNAFVREFELLWSLNPPTQD